MIAIVNYGSGNIQAISDIYSRHRLPHFFASRPEELAAADRLLLPGVGAFDQAMNDLDRSGMRGALDRAVLEDQKPILGICVGMQLLAERSEEGSARGLGWIKGSVVRFDHTYFHQATHLPHMGWNTVLPLQADPLFNGVDLTTGYYFLHSYYFRCDSQADVLSQTDYGIRFASGVRRGHICGVQFHPEKSHDAGVRLLLNFASDGELVAP